MAIDQNILLRADDNYYVVDKARQFYSPVFCDLDS